MVGVIGLGRMGSGIAATLLRAGFDTAVYDITADRIALLVDQGAVEAAGAADVCSRCETVILSMPNSETAVRVIEQDLIPAIRSESVVIDMGTTVAAETRRLAGVLTERGASLIDAPVSGGSVGAAEGTLYVFVGGERSVVDSRWKLLQTLGGGCLTYCGESGSGQITKAVNQLAMGLVDAACIEAVAFGVNAGVDAATLERAVGGNSGFREQFRSIAGSIASGNGDTMDVKYAEHAYFLDEASRKSFPSPLLERLNEFMKQFPEVARDNMERPYPPYWSALTRRDNHDE